MARTPTEVLTSLYNRAISNNFITAAFEQGRIGLLFSVIAAELQYWEEVIERYTNQFNLFSATEDEAILLLSAPLRPQLPSVRGSVILKFTRQEGITGDILVPIGTIVETAGLNPIQYNTIEDVYLYSGQDVVSTLAMAMLPGSDSKVYANELEILVSPISGVSVINEHDSWGERDAEYIEDVRLNALSTRYELEHGTTLSIRNKIRDYGLEEYEFNLEEYSYGYGSIGLWVDTTDENVLLSIKNIVEREKPSGTYLICEMAEQVEIPFYIQVRLAMDYDIPPQQRDSLIARVEESLRRFILQNGVGQDLIVNKATHFIIEDLVDEYEIYDLDITSGITNEAQDDSGDIPIERYQVLKIQSISVSVVVE